MKFVLYELRGLIIYLGWVLLCAIVFLPGLIGLQGVIYEGWSLYWLIPISLTGICVIMFIVGKLFMDYDKFKHDK